MNGLDITGIAHSAVTVIYEHIYYLLRAGFFLGLFFDPEDGGDMFL
jgi:hypothetical protein